MPLCTPQGSKFRLRLPVKAGQITDGRWGGVFDQPLRVTVTGVAKDPETEGSGETPRGVSKKAGAMSDDLPVSGVMPISRLAGDDDAETQMLRKMETKARDFINQFEWCEGIREFYFGAGVGSVFAVFLAQIKPAQPSIDEYLWIVVGDIPSAYLVTDDCADPKAALEGYIWEMRKWVDLAKEGRSSKDVIPVTVPATPEWAETLAGRLDTLEQKIIPYWFTSTIDANRE